MPGPSPQFDGKAFVRGLSTAPGVYRMYAADGSVLRLLRNPAWVIGTLLLVIAAVFVARVFRTDADATSRRLGIVLLTLISTQYVLGILTLIHLVPVSLGVIHQAMALVIFGAWLWWLHHVRNMTASGRPA